MIIARNQLREVRNDNSKASIALRFGCFDVLHAGHQRAIDYTRARADILVIGVMSDGYVKNKKGDGRPVNSELNRVRAIDDAPEVDYSLVVDPRMVSMAGLFVKLKPDVYVEDEEYGKGRLKSTFLQSIGTEYVIDSERGPGSTSEMIAQFGLAEATVRASLTYAPQSIHI